MTSAAPVLLALGWGGVAGWAGRRFMALDALRRRTRALRPTIPRRARIRPEAHPVLRVLVARSRRRVRREAVANGVPVLVDLLAVAVRAGATPPVALSRVAAWVPPSLTAWCEELASAPLRATPFASACDAWAGDRVLGPLARGLAAASRSGAPLAPVLDRIAATERTAARQRAEARARAVPVRLLFPLVVVVLPAFGLLTVAPVVLGGIGGR